MANNFASYLTKGVGTTPVPLLTVAASTQTTVIGLTCANTLNASITADVYVTRSAVDYYIIKNASLLAGSTLVCVGAEQKLVLATGDVLKVVASAASAVDVITSVLNIT